MRQVIVGIGNAFRGDDGIGRHVARRLLDFVPPDVVVLEENGEAANLMAAWDHADRAILIDAMTTGAAPGTVMRFNATDLPLPREMFPHFSTHTYSVSESIELARTLERLPSRVVVYGIEGKDFETGAGLSPEVERAATNVIDLILREIRR